MPGSGGLRVSGAVGQKYFAGPGLKARSAITEAMEWPCISPGGLGDVVSPPGGQWAQPLENSEFWTL